MAMTIEEIKKQKSELEIEILKMLIKFEEKTAMRVEYLDITTDHQEYEPAKKLRKLKGILDVALSVNIENDSRSEGNGR